MVVVKLEHSHLAQHQSSIFKHLQAFRKEGQLCDIVVKSRDDTEHAAHKAVLCAASVELKNMLVGPFVEANLVQQGQPVEMAASDAVVFALIEYIYGEEPQVELEESLELLHLADAYNFQELATAIEAGLHASLDCASVTTALKVLQQTPNLHELKVACEEIVAANFELCIDTVDFLQLSAGQLGRILRRPDLNVSREEVVVKGLFQWFNKSKDRGFHLGLLLQNVDFQSLSSGNLARLGHLSASMGPAGHDLEREVADALQVHKKHCAESVPDAFRPKRHCLQTWSPELGASAHAPQKVLPFATSICCHEGTIYCATYEPPHPSSILRWKPGDAEGRVVAGRGARVNGVNDLGSSCRVYVCPNGVIFVVDFNNRRLVSFQNGSGNVVLSDVAVHSVFCSPNGDVYVLTQNGAAVEKLIDATLHPLISNNDLPADLQFRASDLSVTKDEVLYLLDNRNSRVLRLNPGSAEPVVVGEAPNKQSSRLQGLFVTEDEKIYVAAFGQSKVWAFHPGEAWTEVLTCPGALRSEAVLVQGRSLYVSMFRGGDSGSGIYEYVFPPELQLG
eukprot:Skav219836  [mRNA]  locus=scaffold859:173315:175003:+ [translate_table: standard]